MHLATSLVSLLAAGSAIALENPHRRVKGPQALKGTPAVKEALPVADTSTYQHLNANTKSMYLRCLLQHRLESH